MTEILSTFSNIAGLANFALDCYTNLNGDSSNSQKELKEELITLEEVLANLKFYSQQKSNQQKDPTLDMLEVEIKKLVQEIGNFQKMDQGKGRLRRLLSKALLKKNTLEFYGRVERRKSFLTLTLMVLIMNRLNRPAHMAEDKSFFSITGNVGHTPQNAPKNERTLGNGCSMENQQSSRCRQPSTIDYNVSVYARKRDFDSNWLKAPIFYPLQIPHNYVTSSP